jgi:phosphorylated adapter RNA export protein
LHSTRCIINENTSVAEAANQIADQLGETEASVRKKIQQIVQACGIEQTQAWLEETLSIEASGGMMVNTGERRRTPGGVFFYLVKGRLSQELRQQLFPYHPKKRAKKRSRNQQIQEAPVQEAAREPISENVDRLKKLRQAEQEILERLTAIQALPPSERTGLISVRKDLQKIRAEITALHG